MTSSWFFYPHNKTYLIAKKFIRTHTERLLLQVTQENRDISKFAEHLKVFGVPKEKKGTERLTGGDCKRV